MTTKKERAREHHARNREEINRKHREQYAANRDARRAKQKQYVAENAEKVAARKAAYYRRTRDRWLEAGRERYEANKAIILERQREYRERPGFHEMRAEWLREWHAAHPDARSEYDAVRRARLLGAEAEAVARAAIWVRDRGVCRICDELADPRNWHLDHIVPLSKGGGHVADNVAVTCPPCNMKKGASDPRVEGSPYAYLLAG